MSELSQLIKINRNIEKQNEEIIRLLKKIAGEEETSSEEPDEEKQTELTSLGVGEVYYIDGDLFKLSVKNNESSFDNLTGTGESHDFELAQIIANESVVKNQSIGDATVIVTDSSNGKLAETLKLCVESGAKNVYIPWNQMTELIGAPQEIQIILKLIFYKSNEELLEKLFKQ